MNILVGKNNIDTVINRILAETKLFFGTAVTLEKLNNLKFYLEDMIINKIVSSNLDIVCIIPDQTPNELAAALIASGISSDGRLPYGCFYPKIYIENDTNTRLYANEWLHEKGINLGNDIFANTNTPEPKTIEEISSYAVNLMANLIEFGIGCNEIISGYLDAGDDSYVYLGMQYANYLKAMGFYARYGLENTLACDICHTIYDSKNNNAYYSEIVKKALILIAKTDITIQINGLGGITEDTLEELFDTIEAAKLLDPALIEPFLKRFDEIILPMLEGTDNHLYTNEEKRKKLCRVGNIINFNLIKPKTEID